MKKVTIYSRTGCHLCEIAIDKVKSIKNEFNKYDYKVSEKSPSEQEIDDIIGKRMLQHLKQFFYENTSRTVKRKHKPRKNHTVKRHK